MLWRNLFRPATVAGATAPLMQVVEDLKGVIEYRSEQADAAHDAHILALDEEDAHRGEVGEAVAILKKLRPLTEALAA